MGFYLLPEGIHHKIDMARAKFFWEGNDDKHKYHMVRWSTMCKPKEFGGLGFADSRTRNICLLAKRIIKLERGDQDLSCQVLRKKYLGTEGFYQSDTRGSSQFCKGLHAIKHFVKKGLAYHVGDGRRVSFWSDVWFGRVPLKVSFPVLFSHCDEPDITV